MLPGSRSSFDVTQQQKGVFMPPKGTKFLEMGERGSRDPRFKCLPGEHVYEEAVHVRKSVSYTDSCGLVPGTLYCTSFRVVFRPESISACENGNITMLQGEHDVALSCIEKILAVNSMPKMKVLTSNSTLKFIPEELLIYCRDFRVMHFHFNKSGLETQAFRITNSINQAVQLCSTLAQMETAVPWSVENGGGGITKKGQGDFPTLLFESSADWEQELKRLDALDWRVSPINERFDTSTSLSKYFLVPSKVLDTELKRTFPHFIERRVPRLSWRHPKGSDLLRAANFQPNTDPEKEDLRSVERLMFANHSQCVIVDTADELPSPSEIQLSYQKLRNLCINEIFVTGSDEKWLSSLEGTRWLDYVRSCLRKASDVSYLLADKCRSLVLQEFDDRDMNCVISSLVQIISDPHSRTLSGFQSLVQKEWVAAGHPFFLRFSPFKELDKDQSPVFLLFLDCVWQLLQQFPAAFEFTEMYLIALHDSTYLPIFSTFLFNCQWERGRRSQRHLFSQVYTPINGWRDISSQLTHLKGGDQVTEGGASRYPNVWEWALSYSYQQRAQFRNPVYRSPQQHAFSNGIHPGMDKLDSAPMTACTVYLLLKGSLTLQAQLLPWKTASSHRRGSRRAQSSESLLMDQERSVRTNKSPLLLPPSGGMLFPLYTGPWIRLWRRCYLRSSVEFQVSPPSCDITSLTEELQLLEERLSEQPTSNIANGTDHQTGTDHRTGRT